MKKMNKSKIKKNKNFKTNSTKKTKIQKNFQKNHKRKKSFKKKTFWQARWEIPISCQPTPP